MKRVIVLLFFITIAGCSGKVMESKSPDGNYSLNVSDRPSVDQPAQDILLKDNMKGTVITLKNLKEDWDWVDSIKWRSDSKFAGVLVTRSIILIIDPEKQGIIREIVLKEATNYPPVPYITDFRFIGTNKIIYDIKTAAGDIQREEIIIH
jgi:hypothetical protein